MWEPRHLTTLWVSTACYRGAFYVSIVASSLDLSLYVAEKLLVLLVVSIVHISLCGGTILCYKFNFRAVKEEGKNMAD
jgi:hypothetical protein